MPDGDNTISGLAALIRASVYEDRMAPGLAGRLVSALGIGWDESVTAEALEAGLRQALGSPADPAGRHPRVAWVNAANGDARRRCFPDVSSAWEAAVAERPFNNTRTVPGWCTEEHEAATAAETES